MGLDPQQAHQDDEGSSEWVDPDQLQPEDTLTGDGRPGEDVLDAGYSPPDRWQEPGDDGELSIDEALAQEEPDPTADIALDGQDRDPLAESDRIGGDDPDAIDADQDWVGGDEVGDAQAGRLTSQDQGVGPDQDKELLGEDVGLDGGAASAEEAAVHVVGEDGDALG